MLYIQQNPDGNSVILPYSEYRVLVFLVLLENHVISRQKEASPASFCIEREQINKHECWIYNRNP